MSQHPTAPARRAGWPTVAFLLVVPTIITAVLVGSSLTDARDTTRSLDRTRDLATAVLASGALVEAVQDERAAAVRLLGAGTTPERSRHQTAFTEAGAAVDRAAGDYAARLADLPSDLPADVRERLGQIDGGLRDLAQVRPGVTRGALAPTDAINAYDALVDGLIQLRRQAATAAEDPPSSRRMLTAAAIAEQKERLHQERTVVLHGHATGTVDKTEFVAAHESRGQLAESFATLASAADKARFDRIVAGPDLRASTDFESWILDTMPPGGDLRGAPFTSDSWDAALAGHGRLLRDVEREIDTDIVAAVAAARADERREMLLETGIPVGILLLIIVGSVLFARSTKRG
ncbi:nitrate- and nitrite sensing domain-containing protein [Asanoa siamensis]|uniref:Nitrate/nitrite sensing protein domain-containing protein n=1 Tax=Asanoa siamensis TaxID=926357 RepID=A0ABQ4CKB9_9ACTN|nr:nitrate- and nitrite sensing domain-containing protein [Asanoa siamensis]GIF71727.1 hypothetical protein Asi02nite_12450 [Asanoa siamensis]